MPSSDKRNKYQHHELSAMIPGALPLLAKSYSVDADGSLSYLAPLQLVRHELYEMAPFAAMFGMQERERNITRALADYTADLDGIEANQIQYSRTHQHLTPEELSSRKSHVSLLLIKELEMDVGGLITTPLVVALFVAGTSQFLVGHNTGVGPGRWPWVRSWTPGGGGAAWRSSRTCSS